MLHEIELYSIAVWAIFFGIVFSIVYISLQKKAISLFILKLTENECYDTDTAKSLLQLNITDNISKRIIYNGVKSHHGLIRIIGFIQNNIHKAPSEFSTAVPDDETKFYIEKQYVTEANKKYGIKKSNKLYITICIIILFIIACLANTVISKLTSYAGDVFKDYGSYKPKQEQQEQTEDENTDDNELPDNENIDDDVNDGTQSETDTDVDENTNHDEDTVDDSDAVTELPEDEEIQVRPTIPKGPLS